MARRKKPIGNTCRWTEDEDGNWDMDCGEKFYLSEGTPHENKMRFCCSCGATLVEKRYKDAR